jgi:hypothetical protein
MFHLKCQARYYTWTLSLVRRWNQWQYWILVADIMLEIGTALIPAVCHSMSTCHRQTLLVSWNFVTNRCIALFGTSLSGCVLLDGSQAAANDWMQSSVREWTHVLLVNTRCSHLHSFRATVVRSGLATRVTLTRVSQGRLRKSITWEWTCFWFHFCTAVL